MRTLLRGCRALTFAQAWKYIDNHASDGDLISGHIRYGDPVLPTFRLNYITLLRDPVARVLSNDTGSRLGYQKRNALRRSYVGGHVRAAGTYSFSGYLSYLDESTGGDANIMWAFSFGTRRFPIRSPSCRQTTSTWAFSKHFDLFATDLGRKLGVQLLPRKSNITPQRTANALTMADRRLFERLFSRDIVLYEAVSSYVRAAARQGCQPPYEMRPSVMM